MKKVMMVVMSLLLIIAQVPGLVTFGEEGVSQLRYVVNDDSPYAPETSVRLIFNEGDENLMRIYDGTITQIMWSGNLLGDVAFAVSSGVTVKVMIDIDGNNSFTDEDLISDYAGYAETTSVICGLIIAVGNGVITFTAVDSSEVIPREGLENPGNQDAEVPKGALLIKSVLADGHILGDADVLTVIANNETFTYDKAAIEAGLVNQIAVNPSDDLTVRYRLNENEEQSITLAGSDSVYVRFLSLTVGESITFSEDSFALNTLEEIQLKGNVGTWDTMPELTIEGLSEITLIPGTEEYFIDLPERISPELANNASVTQLQFSPTQANNNTLNVIRSIKVHSLQVNGSSGNSDTDVIFHASSGVARIYLVIGYLNDQYQYLEKTVIINAFQPHYNGLRIETSQRVGEWDHSDVGVYESPDSYYVDKDVYVSATHVLLSLSNTEYTAFEALVAPAEDTRIDSLGNGVYKLNLDDISPSSDFTFSVSLKSGGSKDVHIRISKKVVSVGTERDGGNTEKAYVFYLPDDSFVVQNPKALIMLYYQAPFDYENGIQPEKVLLETRVLNFSPATQPYLKYGEWAAYIGEIDMTNTSPNYPNMVCATLIEGDVSLHNDTFGGVKYGIGDGFNGGFGNYPW